MLWGLVKANSKLVSFLTIIVYSTVITQFIRWMPDSVPGSRQPQTKPTDRPCLSACRLLPSTPTVTIC